MKIFTNYRKYKKYRYLIKGTLSTAKRMQTKCTKQRLAFYSVAFLSAFCPGFTCDKKVYTVVVVGPPNRDRKQPKGLYATFTLLLRV